MKYKPWDPESWGPYAWRILHTIATVTSGQDMLDLMHDFARAAPCDSCSRHLPGMLARYKTRRDAVQMVFDMHNEVNQRLGKTVLLRVPSYPIPQRSLTLCSDLDELVQRMRSRRGPEEVSPFLNRVYILVYGLLLALQPQGMFTELGCPRRFGVRPGETLLPAWLFALFIALRFDSSSA